MDKYYGNVCELDIIFSFTKAYYILDELLLAGELQESSKKNVLRCISQQDALEDMEVRLFRVVLVVLFPQRSPRHLSSTAHRPDLYSYIAWSYILTLSQTNTSPGRSRMKSRESCNVIRNVTRIYLGDGAPSTIYRYRILTTRPPKSRHHPSCPVRPRRRGEQDAPWFVVSWFG